MKIPYIFVIIMIALGGVLIGESLVSKVNIIEIVLGVICILIALVLLIRTPVKHL